MPRESNVLFLVVDSLRYDAVLGPDSVDTPTIDRLGQEGVTFTRCYSQGISTAPAMTAMLTGRYPLEYGGHWYVVAEQPTFAEEFRRNGYATAAIHSNPNVSRLRNFDKGFDTFDEHILPFEPPGFVERAPDSLVRYANKFARLLRRTPYRPASKLNRDLVDWIDDAPEPWFLWTQYMDTHGPYLPGADVTYRNKLRAERLWRKAAVNAPDDVTDDEHAELRSNYRREVEYFDAELGRFLDRLEERGNLDDTVVILVGDHGDEFREHGLYGHANLPYDELTHVPLVIRFPPDGDVDQPAEVEELARCIDVLPTALDYVEVARSPEMDERIVGESLLPTIHGEASPSYDVVVTEKEMYGEPHLRFGYRTSRWKFLYDGKSEGEHLYDLDADPGERRNVVDDHPDVAARFRERLRVRLDRIDRTSAGIDVPDVEEGTGVEERLKALGYRE